MNRATLALTLSLSCRAYDLDEKETGGEVGHDPKDTSVLDTAAFQDSEDTGPCGEYTDAFNTCLEDACEDKGSEDCGGTREACRDSLAGLATGLDCCDQLEDCLPEPEGKGGPDEACVWATAGFEKCCEVAEWCQDQEYTELATCYDTYSDLMPPDPEDTCPQESE